MGNWHSQLIWKSVSSVIPGEMCAESIKSSDSKLVVKSGQILSAEDIQNLKRAGVKNLWVRESLIEEPVVSPEKIESAKKEIVDVFEGAARNMKVNKEVVGSISQDMLKEIVQKYSDKLSLVFLIQQNDIDYTYVHEVHVAMLAILLALELGIDRSMLPHLAFSGMIHDIGKIAVSKDILYAPRRLSEEEFESVKKHVIYGEQICLRSGVNNELVVSGVRDHHEKINGTGYTRRLTNNEISPVAKILAVADIYDALISSRSYKKPWSPHKAVSKIIRMTSSKMLDKKVATAFVSLMGLYPIGTTVLLNSGKKAVVIGSNRKSPSRPIIRIEDNTVVDLARDKSLRILSALD